MNIQKTFFWVSIIVIVTFIAFSPALKNGFTNFDDDVLFTENPIIKTLSIKDVFNIFTTFVNNEYRPLLYVTFAIEYSIVGLKPFLFHFTSLFLHLVNCILVFLFIHRVSKNLTVSLITSILFGIHPLQVQSVAWVAGRDDLLYTIFYFVSLLCYLKYLDSGLKSKKYLVYTFLWFILSILSKPTAGSLVLMLLLLDYMYNRKFDRRVFEEKIPFAILVIIAGSISFLSLYLNQTIREKAFSYTISNNFFGTLRDLLFYIQKAILPIKLSCLYPEMVIKGLTQPIILIVTIYGISKIIQISIKYTKKVVFGSIFYLVTLLPVLKLFGTRPVSDHRVYVPLIGLFYLISTLGYWSYYSITKNINGTKFSNLTIYIKYLYILVFIITTFFLSMQTWGRCKVWKDSFTLWNDVIKKYPKLDLAYGNRAKTYLKINEYDKAINDYKQALYLRPNNYKIMSLLADLYSDIKMYDKANFYYNRSMKQQQKFPNSYIGLGNNYLSQRNFEQSIFYFNKALEFDKTQKIAYNNRGLAYYNLKKYDKALTDYNEAIKLDKLYYEAYSNRGIIELETGNYVKAVSDFDKSIKLNPDFYEAYFNRGNAYLNLGDPDKAIADYNIAVKNKPDILGAYVNRGDIYLDKNELDKAIEDFDYAITRNPGLKEAYIRRGISYVRKGEYSRAIADFETLITIDDKFREAYYNLGLLYYDKGEYRKAIYEYSKAIKCDPKFIEAYKNRGNVYLKTGAYSKALEDYRKGLELNPKAVDVYFNRAILYFTLKEYDKALDDVNTIRSYGVNVDPKFVDNILSKVKK